MEIGIKFNVENSQQEVVEFIDFLQSQNPKGIQKVDIIKKEIEDDKLGPAWTEIIQIVIGASATGIGIKSLFDYLKEFVKLRQLKIELESTEKIKKIELASEEAQQINEINANLKKSEIEYKKAIVTMILNNREISLNNFDENELNEIKSGKK